MKNHNYNNRRVIWESKAKQIWVILISFIFVAIALWTKDKISSLEFWWAVIFWGCGGLFMLVRLVNPNNLFVTHDSELGKQILAEQFLKVHEDIGFIGYTDIGFKLTENEEVSHFNWSDIETIFCFKEDHFTTDEICMDIFFNDKTSIRLTESTPGWYQFNKRLSNAIPSVCENWFTEVVQPPFATNMTLLFDKDNRDKEQAEKACYGD